MMGIKDNRLIVDYTPDIKKALGIKTQSARMACILLQEAKTVWLLMQCTLLKYCHAYNLSRLFLPFRMQHMLFAVRMGAARIFLCRYGRSERWTHRN